MPVVITCPACQQKARVPDTMLGQSVKCPACAATFTAPAEASPPTPPPITLTVAEPARPPLPADVDSLRSVQAGAGVQLTAHCFYAAALATFLLVLLMVLADTFSAGSVMGRRSSMGPNLPLVFTLLATVLLVVGGLLNVVGASICVLAPTAQVARGLAIGVLVMTVIAFLEMVSTYGLLVFMDEMPGRFGGVGRQYWFSGMIILWLVEVTRLVVLALFWRAISRILRDARGATLARRLAIGGPVVQVSLVIAWLVIATLGASGHAVASLAVVGWLAVQLLVVLAGIGIVARLRRRLKAALTVGA
jgi:hypothetical protein